MEILFNLRENLLNIGIAGINIIEQDFRLKNNIEQLGNVCENMPSLKKVYSLCLKLFQEENKTTIYLDLVSLIDAILITQGKNINTENLEEINTYDLDVEENLYSQVQFAITAFSTKFYDRTEEMEEEIENILKINNKIVLDYRVVNYAINSLQDSYSEIPILIKDCFKEIGDERIVKILKEDFTLKGPGMVYRLEIIGSICKEKENDFYLSLLEKSEDDLKQEVIKCLSYDKNNKDLLLDLYEKNNKDLLINLHKNNRQGKVAANNLKCIIFSLVKIEDENDSFIKKILLEKFSSLYTFLKDEKCQKYCPTNKEPISSVDYDNLEYNTIINYLNENINNQNIKYGESNLLGSIYAELLENYLKTYEEKLNLTNFIEKPIQNKRFFMRILKDLCGFYSYKLEEIYFKYLNSNNKFIQLLLSEMLVYNILLTNDKRFIELAFRINKEDKEEMFISSYFLASLLTKPAKEVFEKFFEKVFPKKLNDMKELDKIIYETKALNLQMLLFSIRYENNKHMICVYKKKKVDAYTKWGSGWKELNLYENIYFDWFKFLCNNDRLIFSYRKENNEIFFYEIFHIYRLKSIEIHSQQVVLGFFYQNKQLFNDKEIGTSIYNYILEYEEVLSLKLFLEYLRIINSCSVGNLSYLINHYLTKNLGIIINGYSSDYFEDFIEFFNNMNDDNFESIKNEFILKLNEKLENLENLKDKNIKDIQVKLMLKKVKDRFGNILN